MKNPHDRQTCLCGFNILSGQLIGRQFDDQSAGEFALEWSDPGVDIAATAASAGTNAASKSKTVEYHGHQHTSLKPDPQKIG